MSKIECEAAPIEEIDLSEDPKPLIDKECEESHHCHPFVGKFEACQTRVSESEHTEENCVEEFFDLMECVSHCSGPKLFSKLT